MRTWPNPTGYLESNPADAPKLSLDQLKNDPGIRWLVGKLHVGTPDEEVAANFRKRCQKAGFDEEYTAKVIQAALYMHHQNQGQYQEVMGGFKRRPAKR